MTPHKRITKLGCLNCAEAICDECAPWPGRTCDCQPREVCGVCMPESWKVNGVPRSDRTAAKE